MTERNFSLTALLVIAGAAILAATQWPAFPYFLDGWYHLAVIRGFVEAGGPVLWAFWESAPEGQAHVYPPLFHIAGSIAVRLGAEPVALARAWSVAAFPAMLAAAWFSLRAAGARLACCVVIALCAPFLSFLAAVNYAPATLALCCGLGMMPALARGRPLAAGLLLGAAFWLHAGVPWLLLLSLLIFAAIEPEHRRASLRAALIGLACALPWIAHAVRFLPEVRFYARGEDRFLDSSALLALGAAGFFIAWRRRGIVRFLPALALGFLPMLLSYKFRYFSAQGLFTWLLLAGVALDAACSRLRGPWAPLLLAAVLVVAPGFRVSGETAEWAWADSSCAILAGAPQRIERITAQSVFRKQFRDELVERVERHAGEDRLIWCDVPFMGGMLYALTGRAMTNPLLEIGGRPLEQQLRDASLLLWAKDPSGQAGARARDAARQFGLEPVEEAQIAFVYANRSASARKAPPAPALPWWVAALIAAAAGTAAVRDSRRGA